jgi:hypothetical protein
MKNKAIICDTFEQVEAVCRQYDFEFDDYNEKTIKKCINEGSQIMVFPSVQAYEIMEENFYFESFKPQQQ